MVDTKLMTFFDYKKGVCVVCVEEVETEPYNI